jgi:CO dehydrogenase nickel-insertion accessory protein CooC1
VTSLEPQQITCARIALRKHGGPMRDEDGCACEHCVALRELIAEVKRLDEEVHAVRNQANTLTLKLRLARARPA